VGLLLRRKTFLVLLVIAKVRAKAPVSVAWQQDVRRRQGRSGENDWENLPPR
jgi:hypothetical protein